MCLKVAPMHCLGIAGRLRRKRGVSKKQLSQPGLYGLKHVVMSRAITSKASLRLVRRSLLLKFYLMHVPTFHLKATFSDQQHDVRCSYL